MGALSESEREALIEAVQSGEDSAFVEALITRHVEAFRLEAVAAIEAEFNSSTVADETESFYGAGLADAARIVRDLAQGAPS